jgi:hypothetical protein
MKNTILTRIIKKVLLIEQGGFTLDPEPVEEPVTLKPEEPKKEPRKEKEKETPKKEKEKETPKKETPKKETPKKEKEKETPKKETPKKEKEKEKEKEKDTPFLSDSQKMWLYMAAYYGLLAGASALTIFILRKIGLMGWAGRLAVGKIHKVFGIPEAASNVLRGLNEADVDRLTTFALVEYKRKNITYSEYKKLIKAFKNPLLRSKINKQAFTAAYLKMQKGNMTMAELITFMPKAYQNSSSLKKALYAYEQELNTAIPTRYTAWQASAKLYAEKNAQFRAEFEKLLGTKGIKSPLAPKTPKDAPKSPKTPKDAPKSPYTSTNSATLASDKLAKEKELLAKEKKLKAKKASELAAWNKLSGKVDDIAKDCKPRPFTSKLQLYKDLTINDRISFSFLCNVGPSELETLLMSFKNLKRPAVLTKIKKLAAKNGWNFTTQEDVIESFMEHVLRFFP